MYFSTLQISLFVLARDPVQYIKEYNSTVFEYLEKEGFNSFINRPIVRRELRATALPLIFLYTFALTPHPPLPFSQLTPQGDRCNYQK